MSRRRGEFEHRTSIFEGSFRAWSYLGQLDPTTTLLHLRPEELNPLIALHPNGTPIPTVDGRSSAGSDYRYEPLPRSGLAHPYVKAILTPWLGADAEGEAVDLGLTTLRTWWQHRRKGESGTAIAALGTDRMRGVVDGYTRHFFALAYVLVVQEDEQAPRSLHARLRAMEKDAADNNNNNAADNNNSNGTNNNKKKRMRSSIGGGGGSGVGGNNKRGSLMLGGGGAGTLSTLTAAAAAVPNVTAGGVAVPQSTNGGGAMYGHIPQLQHIQQQQQQLLNMNMAAPPGTMAMNAVPYQQPQPQQHPQQQQHLHLQQQQQQHAIYTAAVVQQQQQHAQYGISMPPPPPVQQPQQIYTTALQQQQQYNNTAYSTPYTTTTNNNSSNKRHKLLTSNHNHSTALNGILNNSNNTLTHAHLPTMSDPVMADLASASHASQRAHRGCGSALFAASSAAASLQSQTLLQQQPLQLMNAAAAAVPQMSNVNLGSGVMRSAAAGTAGGSCCASKPTSAASSSLPTTTTTTPIVFVNTNQDVQIAMDVCEGLNCTHSVKIVETVLRGPHHTNNNNNNNSNSSKGRSNSSKKGSKGNNNKRKSPIAGLLDAVADKNLKFVLIKIDKSSNATRIAREAARNLRMVGFVGKVKVMEVDSTGAAGAEGGGVVSLQQQSTGNTTAGAAGGKKKGAASGADLAMLFGAFEAVASSKPKDVFRWDTECNCFEEDNNNNNTNAKECRTCPRHSQLNTSIFDSFNERAKQVSDFMAGCMMRYGGECSCDAADCTCINCPKHDPKYNADAAAGGNAAAQGNGNTGSGSGNGNGSGNGPTQYHGTKQQQQHPAVGGNTTSQAIVIAQPQQQQQQQQMRTSSFAQQQHKLHGAAATTTASSQSQVQSLSQPLTQQQARQLVSADQQTAAEPPNFRRSLTRYNNGRRSNRFSFSMRNSEVSFGRSMSGLSSLLLDWDNMEDFDVNVDHSANIVQTNMQLVPGCDMNNGGECNCDAESCTCTNCTKHGNASAEQINNLPAGLRTRRRSNSWRFNRDSGKGPNTEASVTFKL